MLYNGGICTINKGFQVDHMRQLGMSNASDKDLEFADPKEEAAYWKRLAQEYEQKYAFYVNLLLEFVTIFM